MTKDRKVSLVPPVIQDLLVLLVPQVPLGQQEPQALLVQPVQQVQQVQREPPVQQVLRALQALRE